MMLNAADVAFLEEKHMLILHEQRRQSAFAAIITSASYGHQITIPSEPTGWQTMSVYLAAVRVGKSLEAFDKNGCPQG